MCHLLYGIDNLDVNETEEDIALNGINKVDKHSEADIRTSTVCIFNVQISVKLKIYKKKKKLKNEKNITKNYKSFIFNSSVDIPLCCYVSFNL